MYTASEPVWDPEHGPEPVVEPAVVEAEPVVPVPELAGEEVEPGAVVMVLVAEVEEAVMPGVVEPSVPTLMLLNETVAEG